jgi:hypothetical protein
MFYIKTRFFYVIIFVTTKSDETLNIIFYLYIKYFVAKLCCGFYFYKIKKIYFLYKKSKNDSLHSTKQLPLQS